MSTKRKRALAIMLFGICLPGLSILWMPDSIETSIRKHEIVLVEGSAHVTVTEGALAGKNFRRSKGAIAIPYKYIFGLGAALVLSGAFVYFRAYREEQQIPQYKYYRDW